MSPILAKSKISRLGLVSVAAQTGLCLTWLQTPEDRFSHEVAQTTADINGYNETVI